MRTTAECRSAPAVDLRAVKELWPRPHVGSLAWTLSIVLVQSLNTGAVMDVLPFVRGASPSPAASTAAADRPPAWASSGRCHPPPPPTAASPDRPRSPPATAPAVWATRPSTPRARDRDAGRACRGCARAVGSPFAAAHTLPAPSGWDRAARRLAWAFPSLHRDREGRGGAIEGLSGATVNSSGRSVWGRARKARRPTTRNREKPTQKESGGQRKDTATPPRP